MEVCEIFEDPSHYIRNQVKRVYKEAKKIGAAISKRSKGVIGKSKDLFSKKSPKADTASHPHSTKTAFQGPFSNAQDQDKNASLTTQACVAFLDKNGWLKKHDQVIKANAKAEAIDGLRTILQSMEQSVNTGSFDSFQVYDAIARQKVYHFQKSLNDPRID